MQLVARYLDDVLHSEPMFGDGFEPDWDDQPWPHKVYDGGTRLLLPDGRRRLGSLGAGLGEAGQGGEWSIELLSAMLRYSYGLLDRRLSVTANPTQYGQLPYSGARWSRGSAAGGGLYPCEVYWLPGPGGAALPGIYHYSPPRHAMTRLGLGDATAAVGEALGDTEADEYLLVTVKLWKNSFKYAEFCYHSVTMDVGCLLGTWHRMATANGIALRPRMWFAETALDELLGLDPPAESVFAVVPITRGPARTTPAASPPPIGVSEVERSARVTRWPRLERVHHAAVMAERQPPANALDAAATDAGPGSSTMVELPGVDDDRLDVDLTTVLRGRKSSFGRFCASPPLRDTDFATILAATRDPLRPHPELRSPGTRTTRIVTIAQHVTGIAPGVYDYHGDEHALSPVGELPVHLQQHYTLSNYNLEQAAALLAIVARPHPFITAGGPRSYRLLNAEIGAVAQDVYLTAAALGVGCGAVLGFVNAGLAPHLGLAGTDSWPMLLVMIGHERDGDADVCFSLTGIGAGER